VRDLSTKLAFDIKFNVEDYGLKLFRLNMSSFSLPALPARIKTKRLDPTDFDELDRCLERRQ
jgi:hypothetical protein